MRKLLVLIPLLLITALTTEYSLFKFSRIQQLQNKARSLLVKKDVHVQFTEEVYDLIKNEYWEKIDDKALSEIFIIGAKELGHPYLPNTQDKAGIQKLVSEVTKDMDEKKKKEFVTKLADLTLAGLRPGGRSRLYSQVNEEALKNMVTNANPDSDHYQTLGVNKEAPQETISQAFEQKVEEIKKEETKPEEAAKKITEIEKAYETVKTPQRRELYDQYKIEPTVTNKFIKPGILYLLIKRISPITFQEFVRGFESIEAEEHGDALILDLRGNIGGNIDILQQFLGPFIGPNQYAFEFYNREETTPYKTTTGWLPQLVPYKNVVILIDENTQSSAEVIAATLKKYNVGVVVGRTTKGWGTIEKVFKLNTQLDPTETYSAFLVHTITLRDDGQPIEGRGVDPLISIDDPNWDKELYKYLRRQDLIDAVKSLVE